jgi:cell wall-associated NlpC family hydrolase
MAVKGMSVAYCAAGGLILYSGIKGATIQDTVKGVLSGNLSLSDTEGIAPSPSQAAPSSSPSAAPEAAPAGAATTMQKYMMAQRGKPYSESNPGRFGPDEYDCSGLVWAAARSAGLGLPGGPSDPAAAIVDPELQWLATLPGSTVITHSADIQPGDILGFTGADPGTHGTARMNADGTMNVGSARVQSCGHIGMAVNPLQYISAYDTAEGIVVNPIGGDDFIVGVRL